jgi:hypothetical protein
MQSYDNGNARNTGKGEAQHRKYKKAKGKAIPLQAWTGP